MIIRKPTKIELKVENDLQDYELFKEKLNERLRNARFSLGKRDDGRVNSLLSGDQLRNQNFLLDAANAGEASRQQLTPDFMTPEGQTDMRRNLYYPSADR